MLTMVTNAESVREPFHWVLTLVDVEWKWQREVGGNFIGQYTQYCTVKEYDESGDLYEIGDIVFYASIVLIGGFESGEGHAAGTFELTFYEFSTSEPHIEGAANCRMWQEDDGLHQSGKFFGHGIWKIQGNLVNQDPPAYNEFVMEGYKW